MPPKKTTTPAPAEIHHAHIRMAEPDQIPTDWFNVPELGIQIAATQGGPGTVNLFCRKMEAQ